MKRKRLLAVLLCLALAFSLMSVTALADGGESAGYCGVSAVRYVALESMVASANAQVEAYVLIAKLTPYDDVAWLLRQVDRTVAPVFAYADYIGAEIVCDYETHYIDGQYVDIDPIRIIKH